MKSFRYVLILVVTVMLATAVGVAGAGPPATPEGDGVVQGWAILAEKDDYDDVDMTNLPVDFIGLVQMRDLLEESGWEPDHVQELRDFDLDALQDGLDWLAESADADDVVVLYVSAHGMYLRNVLVWDDFFAADWAEIPSERRLLLLDSCQAGLYASAITGDPSPYLSIAAVAADEYGWSGLEEEGLPIIGGVFTHYFTAAFDDPDADADGDGLVSVQEAALLAEAGQRTYMHEVVFAVPEFVEGYHAIDSFPDRDPEFPHVVVDDTIGEPLYLALDAYEGDITMMQEEDLRITIVYDNYAYDTRLGTNWGFAALVEYGGQTVLFDTGGDGPTLLGNMALLDIDPLAIDVLALSHFHGDHTGGLAGLVETGARPTVYVPPSFPGDFKAEVAALTDLVEVTPGQEIAAGIYTTGEMLSGPIPEQALVIPTAEGLVVMTGCAHPGIVAMVAQAKSLFDDDAVRLVLGGFHLLRTGPAALRVILEDFRALDVAQVSPSHCTGDEAIALFAEAYGDDYIQGGAGQVYVIAGESSAAAAP